MKLGFIGGGVMAEAILAGVLRDQVAAPADITVSDVIAARRDYLRSTFKVSTTADNLEALRGADIAILAVKPQNLAEVAAGLRGNVAPKQAVLSIIAGAAIGTLVKGLGHEAVVRAMPNTPGQIGAGITVWTATPSVSVEHRKAAGRVLAALGQEIAVPDEKLIDMATALSASGPAYVFLFIETLIDAGVYMGMSRDLATRLAVQTVLGSAMMAAQAGKHPAQLRDMVTSPGGTTAEALLTLEEGGFRATVINAVVAAYEKAIRLGEEARK